MGDEGRYPVTTKDTPSLMRVCCAYEDWLCGFLDDLVAYTTARIASHTFTTTT